VQLVCGSEDALCQLNQRVQMKFLGDPRSGSYQGITSSRNRFGQYVRTRATPVNPASTFQGGVRSRLAANAAAWRTLTDVQRAGWSSLALLMFRTDSLGQGYTPTGFGAFVSVNNNLLASGASRIDDAPALVTPDAPETITLTAAAGTPAFSVAYTPTPLPADTHAFIFASPPRSLGRNFEHDLRLIQVTAAAAASPANILTAYTARFGSMIEATKIFVSVTLMNGGFQSTPTKDSIEVAA
jgi:hypothetical protein